MKEIKPPEYRYEFVVGYWVYHLWPRFVWSRISWMRKFARIYLVYRDITPHMIVNGVMKFYSKPKTSTLYRVNVGRLWFYSSKKDTSFMEYMVKNLQWVEIKPDVVRNGFVCIDTSSGVIWHDVSLKPKKTSMSGLVDEWVVYYNRA